MEISPPFFFFVLLKENLFCKPFVLESSLQASHSHVRICIRIHTQSLTSTANQSDCSSVKRW